MFLDVLYNDEGSIVLIQGKGERKLSVATEDGVPFTIYDCRDEYGRVYVCRDQAFVTSITLDIDGAKHSFTVNKYPSFPDEIIISTCVKNEDDYLVQWIKYYMVIGVTRFILYDNSANKTNTHSAEPARQTSDIRNLLKNYIEDGVVYVIDWPFENHEIFQPGQCNHSLQAFRKCRYIGFLDVDEYMNPQGAETDLRKIFDVKCTNGGYSILCRNFQNFLRLPEDGFNFLQVYTCDQIVDGVDPNQNGEKVFVHPPNVNTFVVHNISNGLEPTRLPKEVVYFNHYRFINKTFRGRNHVPMCDDSIKRIAHLLEASMHDKGTVI